jgi:hypothetical protein
LRARLKSCGGGLTVCLASAHPHFGSAACETPRGVRTTPRCGLFTVSHPIQNFNTYVETFWAASSGAGHGSINDAVDSI